MKLKRTLSVLLAYVMIISLIPGMNVGAKEFKYTSDKNDIQSASENIGQNGYIYNELDNNTPVYQPEIAVYSEIQSKYPENMEEFKAKYPANRNQNPYGTCWAFSAIGLAEFDLINKGQKDNNVDFSELQLAYFAYNSVVDPLGGTEGDVYKYYNYVSNLNTYLSRGGNYEMAARRFNQWVGPVNETAVPYSKSSDTLVNGLSNEYAYGYSEAHLQNAYLMSLKNNTNDIKNWILEHGAVGVMYSHDDSGMQSNAGDYCGYYDIADNNSGHAVMIVGWDDDYNKEKCGGNNHPDNNGAWLIRNSWGEYISYFWMSYETYSLNETAWAFEFSTDDGLDNNYQYDGGLYSKKASDGQFRFGYTKAANVFTVPKKDNVTSESLKTVSLSFEYTANVTYSIDIYTDLTDESKPTSGTKQENAHTEGTTTYAGIYNIPLTNSVELKPESTYAVVVSVDKDALELEYQGISEASNPNSGIIDIWQCSVSAHKGSYYYKGSLYPSSPVWDASPYNYCIKAFTTNNYAINYELDGGTNNDENPLSYAKSDDSIILKGPVKEGYSFAGWYTDSEYTNKITEISAGSTGAYTLYAKWNELLNTSIIGYTLGLKGDINLNFYIDLPDDLSDEAYVEFTDENGNVSKVNTADVEKSSEYNAFAFPYTVGAKYMTTEVSAKVIDGDRESEVYTTTVKNYIDYVLANQTESKYSSVVEVVKTLANYGAAAQIQFDYKTDNLPNSSPYISDSDKVIKDVDFSNYKDTTTNRDSVEGISYYGSSLVLLSETTIRDYFIVSDGHSIDEYVFQRELTDGTKDNITPVKAVVNGVTYYYVEAQNAKAYQLDQAVTVRVQKKDGDINSGLTVKYSAFSYGYRTQMSSTSTTQLINVTRAMYWYWEAALNYKNANS